MSYSKISGSPNTIRFRYKADTFFDLASMKTLYRAKNIKTEKGESLIDDYGISQDERDLINQFMESAANVVFRTVLKITKGVSNAIAIDTSEYEASSTETIGYIDLIILDNSAYNENVLDYVDVLIKDCIVAKIISQWYSNCGLNDEYQKTEGEYLDLINKLYNGLFELRKPTISS